jgi:Type VI secretion system effector, Hcp
MKHPAPLANHHRRSKLLWAAGIVAIYLLPFLTLNGAVDIFLKITGVPGESSDKAHKNEIEVLEWS